jgi:hypothetical protein
MGMFYCGEQIVKMSILNRLLITRKKRNTSRMRKKEKSLGLEYLDKIKKSSEY